MCATCTYKLIHEDSIRFDLIYAIRDNRDAEEERKYADIKFKMDDEGEDNNKNLNYESNLVYLQKHIEYSKKFRPRLSDEAKFMLKEYYLGVRANYGSRRVRESIVTIAQTIAQLKLKDVIDAEDAKETQQVFNTVLEPLQKIVNTTTNPNDIIVEECLNILKESNNIEWKFYTDLIERVCENPQARKYIDNAHRKRNYEKFKPILEKLLNHTHVRQTNRKRLEKEWQKLHKNQKYLRALLTGGTFTYEAQVILNGIPLIDIYSNVLCLRTLSKMKNELHKFKIRFYIK